MSEVLIRRLHGVDELQDARAICDAVWPSATLGTEITPNLLTAMEHAGGYVSAAYLASQPNVAVGAVISFLGRHRASDGQWKSHLHSHMAAVLPEYRDRNIGTLLKLDQRNWCLANDVDVISWTFDPLVRRNARLNLIKLGVSVKEYLVNFYGEMNDELNFGDESDRMMAWWELKSPRVKQALRGEIKPVTSMPAGSVVVPLPADIIAIRDTDANAAKEWRLKVRSQVQQALADGLSLIGLDENDCYVFARNERSS